MYRTSAIIVTYISHCCTNWFYTIIIIKKKNLKERASKDESLKEVEEFLQISEADNPNHASGLGDNHSRNL